MFPLSWRVAGEISLILGSCGLAPWLPLIAPCDAFTTAFGIVFTASVDAQNTGTLPRVLQLPASTHAMALGDAYMMNAGHADAIFYHPARLVGASGFGLDVQRWGANSSSTTVSAARQWLGGGIGVGLQTLQYGAQAEGLLAAPAGQDHLFTLGASPVSERVATVAYARELGGLDIGIATKLVEERVGTTRDAALLVDFGVAARLGPVSGQWLRRPAPEWLACAPWRSGTASGALPDAKSRPTFRPKPAGRLNRRCSLLEPSLFLLLVRSVPGKRGRRKLRPQNVRARHIRKS